MAGLGGNIAENASAGPDTSVGISRHERRLISTVMRVARSLWPRKTAAELSALTGLSKRQCERIVAERTGISGGTLGELIRSDEGFAFLEAVMAEDAPPWWMDFKRKVQDAQLDAAIAELQRQKRSVRRRT